jgi:hypothetical protein
MANPGKGPRRAITVRVPIPHKDRYDAEAAALGLDLGDYAALVMARAHELPDPPYLAKQGPMLDIELSDRVGA